MTWTKKDIEKLRLKHNLPKPKVKIVKAKKKISKEKQAIETVLWLLKHEGIIKDYVEELRFHSKRRFRFDWAIPEFMIAIEFEGIMSKKSRHTTVTGYSNDCIKYNLAQINGWKVLRYTVINYKNVDKDLRIILKSND